MKLFQNDNVHFKLVIFNCFYKKYYNKLLHNLCYEFKNNFQFSNLDIL